MHRFLHTTACIITSALLWAAPLTSLAQGKFLAIAAPNCDYGGELKSIEALDDLTVQFTLCYPDPGLPTKVALPAFAIHSAEQLRAAESSAAFLNNPIGTGPYRLEQWIRGKEIIFSANPYHWGARPLEPTVILRWNAEGFTRWNALQNGEVDGIDNVRPQDFLEIDTNSQYKLYPRSPANVFYLGINNTIPPFDNPTVRLAMAYAINKQEIVETYYPPDTITASQFLPPLIFGYTPDADSIPYDTERAKQLLAESGVPLPIETTLSYRDAVRVYLPEPGVVAKDIQEQLAQVGINVTLELMDSGEFLDAVDAGQLSLHLLGWDADYPDATNFLDYHFGAGGSAQFGFKDSRLTDVLARAGRLSDGAARLRLYKEANNLIASIVPMVPIAHGISATAYAARIRGAYSSLFAAEQFRVMDDPNDSDIIFMQNAEPLSLYCNDESDGETFRACEQINESLLGYELSGGDVVPALALEWSANEDATQWTFKLRPNVQFSDGSTFDAEDVIVSWAAMWDASSPLHQGRIGDFSYFSSFFGAFLNAPPS